MNKELNKTTDERNKIITAIKAWHKKREPIYEKYCNDKTYDTLKEELLNDKIYNTLKEEWLNEILFLDEVYDIIKDLK